MDKVMIFGVFEFIGFHLCKRLLEKGFSVEGVSFDTVSDLFLEEKRLEIGRNANFEEKELTDAGTIREADVKIISVYDWFMTYQESYKERFTYMVQSIKEQNDPQCQLVYLLPIQLLTDWEGEGMEELRDFLNQTKQMDCPIQYFYLPTIFGPWQPESYLFQSVLLDKFNEKFEVREWPLDAIYVDDLLNPLIERIESGEAGSFLFESGIPKSWELCAEYLKVDKSIEFDDATLKNDDEIEKLILKEITPYVKSLATQKEHVTYIKNLQDK